LVLRAFARRIEVVFAAFAVGVRATVTMTRRLPRMRGLTRRMKAAWPVLLLALICARRVSRPAAFERILIFAPLTKRPRLSLTVTIMRSRFVFGTPVATYRTFAILSPTALLAVTYGPRGVARPPELTSTGSTDISALPLLDALAIVTTAMAL